MHAEPQRGGAVVWISMVAFIVICAAVGWQTAEMWAHLKFKDTELASAKTEEYRLNFLIAGLMLGGLVVGIQWLVTRTADIATISAIVFGLILGIALQWLTYEVLVLTPLNDFLQAADLSEDARGQVAAGRQQIVRLGLAGLFCYLAVTILYSTRHDFRFIIPYTVFNKAELKVRPLVLDTSVIIDGRIADICDTKIVDAPLLVPRFVLNELQHIADSNDRLRRARGRRGLDMLNRLQDNPDVDVQIPESRIAHVAEVDGKLVELTRSLDGKLVTNDFNLNKVATLQGLDVINVNDLAQAVRPVVLPGEEMQVRISRPGEEAGQGVGYLEDGTMVVVEGARNRMNETLGVTVTSVIQTSAGRMIFGRLGPED